MSSETSPSPQSRLASSYYAVLDVNPMASALEVRRAFRRQSKLYHPDTTELPAAEAQAKFVKLNEAYATLSNPERRALYDLKIGFSRLNVIQAPTYIRTEQNQSAPDSMYLGPSDRPLSAGEVFVLVLLGLIFAVCFALVFLIAAIRGESAWQMSALANYFPSAVVQIVSRF
ncbi:MAG: J domain-containing protein [Cyanobacteria bacterium P01_H01_bin.15]